eukprot:gene2798-2980_t
MSKKGSIGALKEGLFHFSMILIGFFAIVYLRNPVTSTTANIRPTDSIVSPETTETLLAPSEPMVENVKIEKKENEFPWIVHHVDKNITISRRKMHNTSLLAFKGETILPYHISTIINTFLNVNITLQWADSLKEISVYPNNLHTTSSDELSKSPNSREERKEEKHHEQENKEKKRKNKINWKGKFKNWKDKFLFWKKKKEVKQSSPPSSTTSNSSTPSDKRHPQIQTSSVLFDDQFIPNYLLSLPPQTSHVDPSTTPPIITDVMHQVYAMWPLPLRDFVFLRKFYLSDNEEKLLIHYESYNDTRLPIKKHVIRTLSSYSTWKFQSLNKFCNDHQLSSYYNQLSEESKIKLKEMNNRFVPTEYCKNIPSDHRSDHTYLSLETFVLLEDIPIPWLINYVQR